MLASMYEHRADCVRVLVPIVSAAGVLAFGSALLGRCAANSRSVAHH